MNNAIKISIIIPIYNAEKTIVQTLNSLINQTLSEIEIICVDDGSTDNSINILEDYNKRDHRISIISQKNSYAGVARNNGIKVAKGKYLYFLDADDFLEENALEQMYVYAESYKLDITVFRYDLYHEYNSSYSQPFFNYGLFPDKAVFSSKDFNNYALFQATVGWAWDKLFLNEFVKEKGYFFSDFKSSNDGYFVYMMMASANRIGLLDIALIHHRENICGSVSTSREKNWENGFKMINQIGYEIKKSSELDCFFNSFMNWVVEYSVWYLNTLYDWGAYNNCFNYIREVFEPQWCILEYFDNNKKMLCNDFSAKTFLSVFKLSPEEYLMKRLRQIHSDNSKSANFGWIFPYERIPKNATVVLYGAGNVGQCLFRQIKYTNYCNKATIVDSYYKKYERMPDFEVKNPQKIDYDEYDYVIICILDVDISNKVKDYLESLGVKREKIIIY